MSIPAIQVALGIIDVAYCCAENLNKNKQLYTMSLNIKPIGDRVVVQAAASRREDCFRYHSFRILLKKNLSVELSLL
jgi:hypothetical protein